MNNVDRIEAKTWRELVLMCEFYQVQKTDAFITKKEGKWIWERA